MIDLEKVIKGLECCIESFETFCPEKCPYFEECISADIHQPIMYRDALELLKEYRKCVQQQLAFCDRDTAKYADAGVLIPAI